MRNLILPTLLLSTINLNADSYLDLVLQETNDYRKFVHQSLVNSASTIDNYYFENKNENIEDYNGTFGIIELSTFYNEDENLSFDQSIKIKLQLPKLKDWLNLVFESDEDRKTKDYVEDHTSNRNDSYNLSLLYNKIVNDTVDFKTKLGVKLNNGLDPFVKTQVEKRWDNIYGIDYIFSQSLKQSVNKKLESTSYFKITKELSENLYLHNYNEYYWHSVDKENSEFAHSIYLNQRITNKDLLTYQIGTSINNIDSNMKIKRNSLSLKYRHFYREWLYSDIIPENYYRIEDNFKPKFALRFNIGMYFNKKSYK